MVDQNRASWNRMAFWLNHVDSLRLVSYGRMALDYSLPGVRS